MLNHVCSGFPEIVTLSIDSLPKDNIPLVTAAIAALAVVVSGLVSAYVVYKSNNASLESDARNALTANLLTVASSILVTDYHDSDANEIESNIYKFQMLLDRTNPTMSEIDDHVSNIKMSNVDEFDEWKSQFVMLTNKYLNKVIR